jgi:hypothetical protein
MPIPRWLTAVMGAVTVAWLSRHSIEKRVLRHSTASVPDGSSEPMQTDSPHDPFDVIAGGKRFHLIPRARWDESAMVESVDRYHWGPSADLIPEDLALAWGPLLSPPYAGHVRYSQMKRWYFYGYSDPSLDRNLIRLHSANTHLIPATGRLRAAAECVSKGDMVRLEGWLVDADGIDEPGFHWRTSLSRADEGPDSCETVYVERLTINTAAFE